MGVEPILQTSCLCFSIKRDHRGIQCIPSGGIRAFDFQNTRTSEDSGASAVAIRSTQNCC
jgi:hypothetical protein